MTKESFERISNFFEAKKIENINSDLYYHTYKEFYKTYLNLKNHNIIKKYLNEGGEKVVFTTPNKRYVIKIGKVPFEAVEAEISNLKFFSSQKMKYLLPKTKIKDNYIITERAKITTDQYLKSIGIYEEQDSTEETQYNWNYSCLNTIEDNHCNNIGIVKNKIVLIDYEMKRKEFILTNRKKIKQDWNKINHNIRKQILEGQNYAKKN